MFLAPPLSTTTAANVSKKPSNDEPPDDQNDLHRQHTRYQWPSVLEITSFSTPYSSNVYPYHFWNLEFHNKQPVFMRLNLTLPWGANFAVYGRRNVAPSITQHDFSEFIKGGRLDNRLRRRSADMIEKDPMVVNVTLIQYLDTGRWFLSVYNDDLRPHKVVLKIAEAEDVSTTCPNECSGHGSCYLGKCDCIDGYQGNDCSKSIYFYLTEMHAFFYYLCTSTTSRGVSRNFFWVGLISYTSHLLFIEFKKPIIIFLIKKKKKLYFKTIKNTYI